MSSCPGCGKETQAQARFCANCGRNLKSHHSPASIKRIGMLLTILGGCFFLLPATLAMLGFVWETTSGFAVDSGASISQSAQMIAGSAYLTVAFLVALLFSSIMIILGGGYLISDRPKYRKQGGRLALSAACIAATGVVFFPYIDANFVVSSSMLQLTFLNAPVIFMVQFAGLILAVLGASLGITYRGLLEGLPL